MKVSESHLLPLLAGNDNAADLYRDLIRATQPATAATPGEFDPQIAATAGRADASRPLPHDCSRSARRSDGVIDRAGWWRS